MACSFGWDWGPITVTSGVWKPIWLMQWDAGILDEVGLVADVIDGIPQLRVRTVGRGSGLRGLGLSARSQVYFHRVR